MSEVKRDIETFFPLYVAKHEVVSEVFLVLMGSGGEWSLALTAEWDVQRLDEHGGDTLLGALDPHETGRLLVGRRLEGVDVGDDLHDPRFFFSGGFVLRVHSEEGTESWSMRIEGLRYEIVG